MAGTRGGVAAKIQQIEPRAVFTHCFDHALNLSVNDTIRHSTAIKDCLDTCFEIVKLIKFSPKCDAMLNRIEEEIGRFFPSIQSMCPTRWTVRAKAVTSIIANYKHLMQL